jgi:hypothetical protein
LEASVMNAVDTGAAVRMSLISGSTSVNLR